MGVMTNPDGPTRIAWTSLASIDAQRMRYWLRLREALERFVVWEVKRGRGGGDFHSVQVLANPPCTHSNVAAYNFSFPAFTLPCEPSPR